MLRDLEARGVYQWGEYYPTPEIIQDDVEGGSMHVLEEGGEILGIITLNEEQAGFVPNVTFPCATLQDPATGRTAIYYGAADSCVAVTFTQIDELIGYLKENSELAPGDAEEFRG